MAREQLELSSRPDGAEDGPLCLTVEAAERLGPMLGKGPGRRILSVDIEPGGCLGLRYVVALVDRPSTASDGILLESHGVDVLVTSAALPHLRGVTVDFNEHGFSVRNPRARGACACGASFADDLPAENRADAAQPGAEVSG